MVILGRDPPALQCLTIATRALGARGRNRIFSYLIEIALFFE